MMDLAAKNQLLIKKFLTAYSHNDHPILRELIHPNYTVASRTKRSFEKIQFELPYFKPEISNEINLFFKRLNTWQAGLSEFKVTTVKMIAAGQEVWVDVDFSGIHTGTLFGIQPSAKMIKFRALLTFEIENEKIKKADWIFDNINLLKQLGRSILIENNSERISEYMSLLEKMGLISVPTS